MGFASTIPFGLVKVIPNESPSLKVYGPGIVICTVVNGGIAPDQLIKLAVPAWYNEI